MHVYICIRIYAYTHIYICVHVNIYIRPGVPGVSLQVSFIGLFCTYLCLFCEYIGLIGAFLSYPPPPLRLNLSRALSYMCKDFCILMFVYMPKYICTLYIHKYIEINIHIYIYINMIIYIYIYIYAYTYIYRALLQRGPKPLCLTHLKNLFFGTFTSWALWLICRSLL